VIFSSLYSARLDEELHTDSTVLFTKARRKNAINRGIAQFAELTECFVKWSTVVVTSTAAEYDLNTVIASTDFQRLAKTPIEFYYTDASSNVTILAGQDDLPHRDLKWLDDNEPGWRNSSASSVQQLPSLTYLRPDGAAFNLGFWPPPSTGSSASMKALIPYVAKPPVLVSDTNVPYSGRVDLEIWHQAPVHFAAHALEKLRPDDQASQAQLQQFLGYVSRYVQNTRKKGGQVIQQVKRYFVRGGARQSDRPPDVRT
jgi:hypothetical protein